MAGAPGVHDPVQAIRDRRGGAAPRDEPGDRRRVGRLPVPWHLTGAGLELLLGYLVDLSSLGARIEHAELLEEGLVCEMDLPPALGQARLTSKVVWTRPHTPETLEGIKQLPYESGLAFVDITPEQREELADAIQILKMNE